MAEVTLRMAMRRTHMVWVGVGAMAGAIVPALRWAMRGKDTIAAAAIIRSSTTVAAVEVAATMVAEGVVMAVEEAMAAAAIAEISW